LVVALAVFLVRQFARLQFAQFIKCTQPFHTYRFLAWVEFELDMMRWSSSQLAQVP
jgi:hypothetical protein